MYKFILILIFLVFPLDLFAAAHYVLDGGSGDGSSWSSAWDDLPSSLTRGDTYYIADGTYSSYTFDDSGTSTITIKKATESDHGTETGWSSAYGDGQATWDGTLTFTQGYYTIDGMTRDEGNWDDGSAYGFVLDGGAGTGGNAKLFALEADAADNITLRHFYAYFDQVYTGYEEQLNSGVRNVSNVSNFAFEKSYIKNTSWLAAFLIHNTDGFDIKYCFIENIFMKEVISARSVDNGEFAYNFVKDTRGTFIIMCDNCDDWDIHGNVFWNPTALYQNYGYDDAMMGVFTGFHAGYSKTWNNFKIYNNTWYETDISKGFDVQNGSGNLVSNNIFIGGTPAYKDDGSPSEEHISPLTNDDNAATSVVANADGGDFTLSGATVAGTTYGSPYDIDVLGNIRGEDSTWDRGAYEYNEYAGQQPKDITGLELN